MDSKADRNGLIIIGLVMGFIVNRITLFVDNFIVLIILWILLTVSIGLVLWGCYIWTKIKNRHFAFMFWGLLSPIGLLGISLLKDKSKAD